MSDIMLILFTKREIDYLSILITAFKCHYYRWINYPLNEIHILKLMCVVFAVIYSLKSHNSNKLPQKISSYHTSNVANSRLLFVLIRSAKAFCLTVINGPWFLRVTITNYFFIVKKDLYIKMECIRFISRDVTIIKHLRLIKVVLHKIETRKPSMVIALFYHS